MVYAEKSLGDYEQSVSFVSVVLVVAPPGMHILEFLRILHARG